MTDKAIAKQVEAWIAPVNTVHESKNSPCVDAKEIAEPVTMEEIVANMRDVMTGEGDPKTLAPRVAAARLLAELAKMLKTADAGPRTMIQYNLTNAKLTREEVAKLKAPRR